MNPPFKDGDKHLLKAIELQSKGGQIVCLLNAETLRNPYSNSRKDLIIKLNQLNADVEFIEDAFIDAERKTGVEVALINITIPKPEYNSTIIADLKQEERFKNNTINNNQVIHSDFLVGLVERYNFEVKAGLKLIDEYNSLKPLMLDSLDENEYPNPILELKIRTDRYSTDFNTIKNDYIKLLRNKYWKALFTSNEFMQLFTSNLRTEYYNKVAELQNYDFSLFNIYSIRKELSKELITGVEDTILNLFEELSHKHHYYNEKSSNIHYYNGWKTNKAYKINKKVIIPLNGFSRWDSSIDYDYNVKNKLSDIEKVFNYLDGGITDNINIEKTLDQAKEEHQTRKIELKYFYVTFYKKGTCHIEFKDLDLLHKFNLFGSQKLGWLPPSYGYKVYKDMTTEEKRVINEFEGEQSYKKVINNKDYYIVEFTNSNLLTG